MSLDTPGTLRDFSQLGLNELRRNWGWYLGLGVLLIVGGVVAIAYSVVVTIVSMLFFGWLLLIAGGIQLAHSFWRRGWSGLSVDLLAGLLYLVAGALILANPEATALALTLLVAMFLFVGGLFRIFLAVAFRFPNWIWLLIHGAVSLALGLLIWMQWPSDALWVIGLFIGIDMIFNGWALVMLGIVARSLPKASV